MKITNYKKRIIDSKLETYLRIFSAVLIEGPKRCGKTWTGKFNAKSEFLLSDPKGNFNNKMLASLNPDLILSGENPRLLDEWQEVPEIWDAVRGRVDTIAKKGLFILTGSVGINKNSYIHSGTGRIVRIKMRPMSLYESGFSDGKISLKDICDDKAKDLLLKEVSLESIIDYILIGGWPGSADLNSNDGILVAKEYVNSVINEDIYKIDNVKRDIHKIGLLLKSLARNESTTVSNTTLKKDIKDLDFDDINIDSITEYLNVFKRLYLIDDIEPFSSNIRSSLRVKQNSKRHFVDPSLPAAILNLTKEKLFNDLNLLGFLFESLVERDLLIYSESFNAKLYHYQDYKGNEIDAVIELEDGNWCGFEIKLGANKIEEAAMNLIKVNNQIKEKGGKPAKVLCVICGLTNLAYKRKDGIYVVPITSLKN